MEEFLHDKFLTIQENVDSQRGSHRHNITSKRQNKSLFTPRAQGKYTSFKSTATETNRTEVEATHH